MRFFKTRERPDVAKLANVTEEIHEVLRQRSNSNADGHPSANNVASLLQRARGVPEQELDNLIAELQTLREKLQREAARVQQSVVDYATLSQSAMQSANVISECLQNSLRARRQPSASAGVSPRP